MFAASEKLRHFYASRQGELTRDLVLDGIDALWPQHGPRARLMTLGYAAPYLGDLSKRVESALALAPASQGAFSAQGKRGKNAVALIDETKLPLGDASVDIAVVIHALECTESRREMLREIWRVLAGGGTLVAVVPNRTGLWWMSESSAFGSGAPFSGGQIRRALGDAMFEPLVTRPALCIPPWRMPLPGTALRGLDKAGRKLGGLMAGVNVITARKTLYGGTALPVDEKLVAFPSTAVGRGAAARSSHLQIVDE
ncbi:MAG: methyltransferase domain-containing protein [Alphaproteobacteria bacterium]